MVIMMRPLSDPVRNEGELARIQAALDKLIEKPEERLSPEESALLGILSLLIEDYEKVHYPMPEAPPYKSAQDADGRPGPEAGQPYADLRQPWRCFSRAERDPRNQQDTG